MGTQTPGVAGDDVDVDVCIVGAWPAGLTVALELANSGLRIAIVERGPASPPQVVGIGGIARGLPYPLEETRAYGIGGTARLWCVETPDGGDRGRFRELDREDVEGRDDLGIAPWPVGYDDIAAWYPRAREVVGLPVIAPHPGDDPVAIATAGRIVPALFEFPEKSVFVTRLPQVLSDAENVSLLCDSRVTGIDVAASPQLTVSGISLEDGMGHRRRVSARVTVLAAGAVENARLLLVAGRTPGPGIDDRSGQLGRGFTEHLHFSGGVLFPRRSSLLWDPTLQGFARDDAGGLVERRYTFSRPLAQEHRLPRSTVRLVRAERSRGLVARVLDGRASSGVLAAKAIRGRERSGQFGSRAERAAILGDLHGVIRHVGALAGHRLLRSLRAERTDVFLLVTVAEQLRRPTSRVVLGPADDHGVPCARVEVRLAADEAEALHDALRVLDRESRAAGIGRVRPLFRRGELPADLGWGHHHMGTTVMSRRPSDGVVDTDLRVHGTRNLFVAGSSVFPSGGHANPTLTLLALSCRLAAKLRADPILRGLRAG